MSGEDYLEMAKTSLSATPLEERPRERLMRLGSGSLATSELLALCLGHGSSGDDVAAMSQRLLQQFGGLEALLAAPLEVLLAQRGLGQARVGRLKAIHELTLRRFETIAQDRPSFVDAAETGQYLKRRIGHAEREQFAALFLDQHHRLLAFEVLFLGTIDCAHVHAREILKRGLALNAAALVLAHNHPSGITEPSRADIALTQELKALLAKVDIRLLDHIIAGKHDFVSMAGRGLLQMS